MLAHHLSLSCCDPAGSDDRAAVHDGEVVRRVPCRNRDIARRAGCSFSLPCLQEGDGVADLIDDVRLNAFGRLVEDEDLRLGEQRAADGELLLLAAGEHAAFAREEFLEDREEAEDAVELRRSAFLPLGDRADVEVFLDGEVREDVAALRDVADARRGARCPGDSSVMSSPSSLIVPGVWASAGR